MRKKKSEEYRIVKALKKYESEEPKILPQEISSDSQLVYGADDKGNFIQLKLTRLRHRVSEVWIILRLKNGETYTLPHHPNTRITDATPRIFEAAGLKIEFLVPYSKLRITFNGLLRKGIQNESYNGIDEEDLFFVKFNFLWSAASNPLFWPYDWSPKLMATSLATEEWRDGRWANMILKKNSGGYDQFGALFGHVKIYQNSSDMKFESLMNPKFEEFEMNLPGLRQRRWGVNKVKHLHRTGVLIGVAKDGTVFEVGALSGKYGLTHTQFGNVRLPNGDTHPIDWTDFHLSQIAEYHDESPQATVIKFEAGNQTFNLFINFKNNQKVRLYGGNPIDWNAYVIPMEIAVNSQVGFGLATFWYPRSDFEDFEVEEMTAKLKRVYYRLDRPSPSQMIVPANDLAAQSIFVSGGKGASLALLKTLEESSGTQFMSLTGNEQVLDALVDSISSNPMRRSLKHKPLLHEHGYQRTRKRSGSVDQTQIIDSHSFGFNFDVPAFFIVSTSAMENHLKDNGNLMESLKHLEGVAYQRIEGDLKAACEKVADEFFKTSLRSELIQELKHNLFKLRASDRDVRFAVRSSCVLEDGEVTSSAGQNETFLGLNSDDEIIEGILQCWISLFSCQSVSYRVQHIQPIITEMAVVIQEMVPSDCSGVMFTCSPANGDAKKIIITANWGLGQTVVGGQVEPDTYLVQRSFEDKLELIGSQIGTKHITFQMDDEEIAKEVETEPRRQKVFCLNESMTLGLAKIGLLLEKFYGSPRDVEWAICRNKIYILQSRSVTSLNAFSNFELLHEFDDAVMSPEDFFTRANIGEAMPGAASSLTISVMGKLFEKAIRKLMRVKPSSLFHTCFPNFSNHLFLNANQTSLKFVGKEISVGNKVESLAVYGYDYITPDIHKVALHRNKKQNPLQSIGMIWGVLRKALKIGKTLKNIELLNETFVKQKYSPENLEKFKEPIDLYKDIQECLLYMYDVFFEHTICSNISIMSQLLAFSFLTKNAQALTTSHQNDIALILGSVKDVESAEIPELLNEIAMKILVQGKKDEFLETSADEAIDWLEENCPEAYKIYQKFMERHGHRGLAELDFISVPYEKCPEKIVEIIRANVNIEWDYSPAGGRAITKLNDEAIIENLKTPIGFISKFLLKKLLPKAKSAVRNREYTKSKSVAVANEIRKGFIGLGLMMVHEGLLPDASLIFHITNEEIKKVILFRDSSIVSKAIRRQKLHEEWNTLKFPILNFGRPRPIVPEVPDKNYSDAKILVSGTIVCGGVVEGRACVIKDLSEAHKIRKGDILVTYCTDIAWSPYFPLLKGICTELGGLISHAAVISREYSLPCIVGARGATTSVILGRKVQLNADEGLLRSLD